MKLEALILLMMSAGSFGVLLFAESLADYTISATLAGLVVLFAGLFLRGFLERLFRTG